MNELSISTGYINCRHLVSRSLGAARVGYCPSILIEDIERLIDLGAAVRVAFVRVILPPASPLHYRLPIRIEAELASGFAPLPPKRFATLAEVASLLTRPGAGNEATVLAAEPRPRA